MVWVLEKPIKRGQISYGSGYYVICKFDISDIGLKLAWSNAVSIFGNDSSAIILTDACAGLISSTKLLASSTKIQIGTCLDLLRPK